MITRSRSGALTIPVQPNAVAFVPKVLPSIERQSHLLSYACRVSSAVALLLTVVNRLYKRLYANMAKNPANVRPLTWSVEPALSSLEFPDPELLFDIDDPLDMIMPPVPAADLGSPPLAANAMEASI